MTSFKVTRPPKNTLPIIASIPHAGEIIPSDISSLMNEEHLQFPYHTDWHVDKLFNFLPELGILTIQATHSRYVVDLNRPPEKPWFGTFQDSPIFAFTSDGKPIYHTKPEKASIESRIPQYYTPYHIKLTEMIEKTRLKFGKAFLLDLHSFQSHYLSDDVCLGNINGTTSSSEFFNQVMQCFLNQDFSVANNDKFIGGYITAHYAQMKAVDTIQIELRRAFYLDQKELKTRQRPSARGERFKQAREKLYAVFSNLVSGLS
jgi:N-formylglutamate amidohydrolase